MSTKILPPRETSAPSRSIFRAELQGLRALAVGLVLLFHLWPERVSGGFVGVDVFFVVSGFLITGHIYREMSTTGTIKLAKFWARRAMRLLPLAFTVLLFSLIVMILFLPQTVWTMNVRQILGSIFYIENWVLAIDSVDYMAADNEPSLVQHYWSLSIEEQFYVILPLLLLGSYTLLKLINRNQNRQLRINRIIIVTLAVVLVASLVFSVLYTNYTPAQAYFVTPTRFWEFATGGLLAMLPAVSKVPSSLQNLLGWFGIGLIVIAGVLYSSATPFPGYTALVPVLGTALFIRYGSSKRFTGIYWWASLKPAIRAGDWSYAIYLWHWPLIVTATYILDTFTWPYKFAVIVLTLILSAASQRYIEDPMRHAKPYKLPRRAFSLMGSSMAVIAILTFVVPQSIMPNTDDEIAIAECVGADALLSDCENIGTEGDPHISAAQVQLEAEDPSFPECNIPDGDTDFDRSGCSLGAPQDSADLTVAILGDSHARAWLPMLDELGKEKNWNIQGYTKSGCTPVPLSASSNTQSGQRSNDACHQFVLDTSEEFLNSEELDIIITAASPTNREFYNSTGETSDQIATNALYEMWEQWEVADKDVVVIGELPHFNDLKGPTCIITNPQNIEENCSRPVQDVVESRGTIMKTSAEPKTSPVDFYDPVPGVCDESRCYSMVGQIITRYDAHHLSADFSRSYSSDFSRFLQENALAVAP